MEFFNNVKQVEQEKYPGDKKASHANEKCPFCCGLFSKMGSRSQDTDEHNQIDNLKEEALEKTDEKLSQKLTIAPIFKPPGMLLM